MRNPTPASPPEPIPPVYRAVMRIATPIVRWWGRLEVIGAEVVPATGGLLIIANHDSMWDPVVIGVATRRRHIRALAKASLWHNPVLSTVLDGMGQIPIERGRGDLEALAAAVKALEQGGCVGVFPEGTRSGGKRLRALSGAGRLALAVPDAVTIGVGVRGAVDIARFPKRPHVVVEFFRPQVVQQGRDGRTAITLTKSVMAEVRERAPHVASGRHPSGG